MSTRTLKNAGLNTILGVLFLALFLGVLGFFSPAKAGPARDLYFAEYEAGCVSYDTLVNYVVEAGVTVSPMEGLVLQNAVSATVDPAVASTVSRGFLAIRGDGERAYAFEMGGCMTPPVPAPGSAA